MSAASEHSEAQSEWIKVFSDKHATYYWFNKRTSASQWTEPPGWTEPVTVKMGAPTDNGSDGVTLTGNVDEALWIQHFSKTHENASYWVNSKTGEKRWSKPDDSAERCSVTEEDSERVSKRARIDEPIAVREVGVKIAIIVPFRDNHPEQKRSEHLAAFIPALSE